MDFADALHLARSARASGFATFDQRLAKRAEEHVKGMVIPGTLFEEFGFNYIGPIDGHDINALVETLRNMRNLKGPQLLHVKTKKGKGYAPADTVAKVDTINAELTTLSREIADVVKRLQRPGEKPHGWWALGRIGSRVPLHGSAHTVVPPEVARYIAQHGLYV